jgi:preprotein translocase subunit SecG
MTWLCSPTQLVVEAAAIISRSVVGGDNDPSDRVTPRNFRKTRKPDGAAEDAALFACDGRVEMQTVIIVVHLMIVAVLIGAVLLQKSEGGGLGMGGGAGFMSSRGTANLLTRTTGILAAGFFLTSLWLAYIAGADRKPSSILGTAPATQTQPAGGAVPITPPTSGGVLDTLKKVDEQQGQPAPTGPTAPRSQ